MTLSAEQSALTRLPLNRNIWLEGIAGSGKTTVGVARALHLLERGEPG